MKLAQQLRPNEVHRVDGIKANSLVKLASSCEQDIRDVFIMSQ